MMFTDMDPPNLLLSVEKSTTWQASKHNFKLKILTQHLPPKSSPIQPANPLNYDHPCLHRLGSILLSALQLPPMSGVSTQPFRYCHLFFCMSSFAVRGVQTYKSWRSGLMERWILNFPCRAGGAPCPAPTFDDCSC